MLNAYGEQLIHNIRSLSAQGKYEDALKLVEEECSMPYVEPELDEQLQDWLAYLRQRCEVDTGPANKQYSDQTLRQMLKGTIDQQTAAVLYLSGLNLRQKHDLIQDCLLQPDLDTFARGYLIHVLKQQEIKDVYYLSDGTSFVPVEVTLPEDEAILPAVLERFDRWFGNDEPSMKDLCVQVLQEELYRRLPEEVSQSDAQRMAVTIAVYVLKASGRKEEIPAWLAQNSSVKKSDLLDLRLADAQI